MKRSKTQFENVIRNCRMIVVFGILATAAATVACSSNSKPSAKPERADGAIVRPAAMETVLPSKPEFEPAKVTNSATAIRPKSITYKSRDYGVSFVYPRQYAYLSAKTVANGDSSLKPKSDGHDGQFTLARIDIPKGFYPDTDFDSGYFALSLNQEIGQEECEASLNPGKDSKVQTETINGVEFRWIETESGGGGSAEKLRNYVSFTNGTCYELEMGVNTKNDGLAREIDPDQVMRRLDGILATVKVVNATQKSPVVESSAEAVPNAQN